MIHLVYQVMGRLLNMLIKPRISCLVYFWWIFIVSHLTAGFKFTSSPADPLVAVLGKNSTDVTLSWKLTFENGDRFSVLKIFRFKKDLFDKTKIRLLFHDSGGNTYYLNSSLYSANTSASDGPFNGYAILTIKDILRQPNNKDGSLYKPLSEVYVYRLTVTLPNLDNDQDSEVEVQIYSLPRVVHTTPDQWIPQGHSVTLQCNATGHPPPSISWKKKTAPLKQLMTSSSMVLNITGKQSGGQYCCVAVNRYGNDTSCIFVNVIALPHVVHTTPDQWIPQGHSLPLHCNATGHPPPIIYWKNKTAPSNQIMNSSSMVLNITGKQSGGQYCCVAVNRYGNDTNCIFVNVTEYQPINTKMESSKQYITKNMNFTVWCTSDALPAAVYTFHQAGSTPFNSSDGRYSTRAISDNVFELITCIPVNQYGKGHPSTLNLTVHGPPSWINTTTTYSMINTSVTIACSATGKPPPKIIWTNSSKQFIDQSSTGNLLIPYKRCNNESLVYHCMASNELGNTTSRRVTVQVNSLHDCDEPLIPTNEDEDDTLKVLLIAIIVSVVVISGVVLAVGLYKSIKKKKAKKARTAKMTVFSGQNTQSRSEEKPVQMMEESPYGEPIDAIRPQRILVSHGDYASVLDEGAVQPGNRGDNNRLYASVMNSRSPKKKSKATEAIYAKVNKNKKSKDHSTSMPLYEEIPGRQSSNAII